MTSYRHSWKETRRREQIRIATDPSSVESDLKAVFRPYDLSETAVNHLTTELSSSPKLVEFLMEFHHKMPEPASTRAVQSAMTIAIGYIAGGIVPLLPYLFFASIATGFWVSSLVMGLALFVFGYVKTCAFSGWSGVRCVREGLVGGVQMVLVGGVAAACSVFIVRLFEGMESEY
jgi:vacuolar iron transporter family protein